MDYNNYNRGYIEDSMTSADYMTRTYGWMAAGLLVTFAAAFITAATPLFYVVNSLYLLFTIAELGLVLILSSRVQNMSVGAARGVFLGYALLNGMVLSYYFVAFSVGTLVLAFLATSLYFGLMAVYGTTTHKDLSGWGPRLMIALISLLVTGVVGMFFGSGFGGSILFLYGLFLTPAGNRIGGSIRVFLFEFLIQGIHIGIVRLFNQLFSLVIGFQLLTVNRMIYSIGSRFNRFFALMNRLNTDIIIFVLSYRPVSLGCDCR